LIFIFYCFLFKKRIKGIDSGAIIISGGKITFTQITFINNSITLPSGFPNLRHNVFISDGADLNINSITVDTTPSCFVYISENPVKSSVVGVDV
jgi:hypothetical protein